MTTVPENIQERHPLTRWKVGHRAFFSQMQGAALALHRFQDAVEQGRLQIARNALEDAGHVLEGSAAAFRFTGDLPPRLYKQVILPSMAPPNVGEGFSGLLSTDHDHLRTLTQDLKSTFDTLPSELRRAHERFRWSYEQCMRSHLFVCLEFGGDERASVRSEDVGSGDLPAGDVLSNFFANRIANVTGSETGT